MWLLLLLLRQQQKKKQQQQSWVWLSRVPMWRLLMQAVCMQHKVSMGE
jgi:hypothetical protein